MEKQFRLAKFLTAHLKLTQVGKYLFQINLKRITTTRPDFQPEGNTQLQGKVCDILELACFAIFRQIFLNTIVLVPASQPLLLQLLPYGTIKFNTYTRKVKLDGFRATYSFHLSLPSLT